MEILNVFIAIVVALGFWRRTSKEQKRKTANASLTKTVVFLLLSIAVMLFYYKTYQIARFVNYIRIDEVKGNFKDVFGGEPWTKEDSALYIQNKYYIPYDKVSEIRILNRFTSKPLPEDNVLSELFYNDKQSGISTVVWVNNREERRTIFCNEEDSLYYTKDGKELDYMFNIYYFTNEIPSIFPFTKFSEFKSEQSYNTYYSSTEIQELPDDEANDLNTLLINTIARYIDDEDPDLEECYDRSDCFADGINTLNFLSAADLSQCEFEIRLFSDVPVDSLYMHFDIPIVISGWDHSKYELLNRGFKTGDLGEAQHNWGAYIEFHATLPTLANMQLIRSLILTTLLTAVISLFLSNLYYYLRKLHLKYLRHHRISYKRKKRFLLVFVPSGKIIAWIIMITLSYLLWKVYKGDNIHLSPTMVEKCKYYILGAIIIISASVYGIIYLLYLKGIYLRDIPFYCKRFYNRKIIRKPWR